MGPIGPFRRLFQHFLFCRHDSANPPKRLNFFDVFERAFGRSARIASIQKAGGNLSAVPKGKKRLKESGDAPEKKNGHVP